MSTRNGHLNNTGGHEVLPTLATFDFDGTIAATYEKVPGGHDVTSAYADGIRTRLGDRAARQFLREGHGHGTPADIVGRLMDTQSKEFSDTVRFITDHKLSLLLEQVGQPLPGGGRWPRPMPGFIPFWESFQSQTAAGAPLHSATVSAGHTEFQQRVFDTWGQAHPDAFITEDVITTLGFNLEYAQQVKPAPLMVELAKTLITYKLNQNGTTLSTEPQVIHFGDAGGPEGKDEQLAVNAGARFVFINKESSEASWEQGGQLLGLGQKALQGAQGAFQ